MRAQRTPPGAAPISEGGAPFRRLRRVQRQPVEARQRRGHRQLGQRERRVLMHLRWRRRRRLAGAPGTQRRAESSVTQSRGMYIIRISGVGRLWQRRRPAGWRVSGTEGQAGLSPIEAMACRSSAVVTPGNSSQETCAASAAKCCLTCDALGLWWQSALAGFSAQQVCAQHTW